AWPMDSEETEAVSGSEPGHEAGPGTSSTSPSTSDVDDEEYETAPDDDTGESDEVETQRRPPPGAFPHDEVDADLARSPSSPLFWSQQRHRRTVSGASSTDGQPGLIRLEDHTEDRSAESNRGVWAKSVSIDDNVVVKGKTGVGAYTVWICRIQTLEGGSMTVRM
ncbi:PX domain-containing protein ypt35, partial [Ascosphaera atra]